MPIYAFKCTGCKDILVDKTLPMSQSQDEQRCELCGQVMQRDYASEHAHASADSYSTIKWSDSLAMAPAQIEEHRRLFPDVAVDSSGRPGFDNYRQHDAYLEKCGFVKQSAKRGKRRSTRIS